ncbi:MAG TPA: VCBS repeat-containing protein, partial [Acidobacteriaceae bacterium]|nr:VCBS repeat-containing protein [Acidobacteriaceae bacterium]
MLPVAVLGQTQPPIFPTTQFTAQTGVVLAVASGDFNGDGLPDVASAAVPPEGTAVPTITVLLDQGANGSPVSVATNPLSGCSGDSISMAAADMNKDNKLDLVLTCSNGYVAVLLGNGDGSFQGPAYYAVSGLQALAPPVDLNGDGYLDVAVSSLLGNSATVSVLLNQGSTAPGKLATPASYPAPAPAGLTTGPLATGDFNGDGKQDIVAGGSSLAVFFGNGDGT